MRNILSMHGLGGGGGGGGGDRGRDYRVPCYMEGSVIQGKCLLYTFQYVL